MRQTTTNTGFLLVVSLLLLISCNQPASNSEKNDKDTATRDVVSTPDGATLPVYDPSMDSYNWEGGSVKKLGDTLGVKMYEFTSKPGESWKLHTHPDHTAYILQGGKVVLFNKELGRHDTLNFSTGMALIGGPLSDSGKNIGNTTLKVLVTDIYRPRNK